MGTYDEHFVFHVPKHREDGTLSIEEDPSTSAQEHISLCIDQNHSDASVGTTGYCLGGFHLL